MYLTLDPKQSQENLHRQFSRFSHYMALFTASALTALPVLIFNGHGWYPVIDFYKWVFVFTFTAYGVGITAFLFLAEKANIRVTRVELAWLALVPLSAAQLFFIPLRNFHEWIRNAYFFAALGGAAMMLRNLPIDAAMPGILRATAVTGGVSTVLGFVQNLAPDLKFPFILDASGAPDRFLANTGLDNLLGAYLALAIVAGSWLLLYEAPGRGRAGTVLKASDFSFLIINSVGIWKTGTRSALIACAAGLVVLWAASGLVKKYLKALTAVGLLLVCVPLAAPEAFRVERRDMSGLFTPENLSAGREGRWSIWLASWEMIKSAPLLGVGLGNYKWNYLDALSVSRETYGLRPRYTFWAHNEYLQWIAETGLAGGGIFFSFLICCAGLGVAGLKKAKGDKNKEKTLQLSWCLAALTVLAADSCFSRPLHHVDTAFTLPLALAMISRLEAKPLQLPSAARLGMGSAMILLSFSGIVLLSQTFQEQKYLGEYFYNTFYISLDSSEEREAQRRPLLFEDVCLQLTARENYYRTMTDLGDGEQNDKDAIRLLSRCFETRPRYEELNLLMLLYQERGDFEAGRRYFKYYPPDERGKFLEGRFDGRYMTDR
jgi:O-antigen ligase